MAIAGDGKWTEEDTELCRGGGGPIESGMVYNKSTGKPLTFTETQAQYDDYEPARSGLDYETFTEDKIEMRPFESRSLWAVTFVP